MSGHNPQKAEETHHVILNREQAIAIRFLLSLVHYDDLAQSVHDVLPPALQVSYKASKYDKDFDLAERVSNE